MGLAIWVRKRKSRRKKKEKKEKEKKGKKQIKGGFCLKKSLYIIVVQCYF